MPVLFPGTHQSHRYWQPVEDETMRLLYTAGETWGAIARAFGTTRQAVQARGARIGLTWREDAKRQPRPLNQSTVAVGPVPAFTSRPPLPAGHPITWGAITLYTPCLWGVAYGDP